MILIRPFTSDEWEAFRAIRLEALQTEPGVFAASHAEAVLRPESGWRALLEGTDRAVFGLFDETRVIGLTAVLPARGEDRTAVFVMSYIAPEYRGRGLARLLYEARLAWLANHPSYDRVVVSHRGSNEASRRANQRHGFAQTGVVSRVWPDGVTEDELLYELRLRPADGN